MELSLHFDELNWPFMTFLEYNSWDIPLAINRSCKSGAFTEYPKAKRKIKHRGMLDKILDEPLTNLS